MSTGEVVVLGIVGIVTLGWIARKLVSTLRGPMTADQIQRLGQYADRVNHREELTVAELQEFYALTKRAFWEKLGVKSIWVMLVTGMIYWGKRRDEKRKNGVSNEGSNSTVR